MKNYHASGYRRNKKPPTDFALKGKTERIGRAIALIRSGSVVPYSDGQWLVESRKINQPCRVTITTCQCADLLLNRSVCKHRWPVIAAVSVIIIDRFLVSISELKHVSADCREELNTPSSELLLVIVIKAAHKMLLILRTYRRFEYDVSVMYFCNEPNETGSSNACHAMKDSVFKDPTAPFATVLSTRQGAANTNQAETITARSIDSTIKASLYHSTERALFAIYPRNASIAAV
jgi:hypothetical protein